MLWVDYRCDTIREFVEDFVVPKSFDREGRSPTLPRIYHENFDWKEGPVALGWLHYRIVDVGRIEMVPSLPRVVWGSMNLPLLRSWVNQVETNPWRVVHLESSSDDFTLVLVHEMVQTVDPRSSL